jgi:hypothetical protein
MSEVIIHDDESFERALKRFKKKCKMAPQKLSPRPARLTHPEWSCR